MVRDRSRRGLGFVCALTMTAAACGGGDAPQAGEPVPVTPTGADEATELPVDQPVLALEDTTVSLSGARKVLAVAGETVVVDHLLYNNVSDDRRSVAIRASAEEGSPEPGLSAKSVRLDAEAFIKFTTSLVVPEDAEVGATYRYEVLAVVSEDITQRSSLVVDVEVIAEGGTRPDVTNNGGRTSTNEKVTVYVVGDDTDADSDLDYSTLRVIGGGFRAASVTGSPNGTIEYVPFANLIGTDALIYELCDTTGRCDTGVVTVTVEEG